MSRILNNAQCRQLDADMAELAAYRAQGTQPKEVHPMMNRNQAIAYGKHIGVRWHIYNSNGCLVGGTKTLEQAQAMKRRFEIEERSNPWTHGKTRFEIREAK